MTCFRTTTAGRGQIEANARLRQVPTNRLRSLPGVLAALCLTGLPFALPMGCGNKDKGKPVSPSVSLDAGVPDAAPPPRRVLQIELEYVNLSENPPTTRVALILTDETGSARREVIGEFDGGCSDVTLAVRSEAMKPLLGLDCWTGESGTLIRFVHRRNNFHVIVARVTRGEGDPAFEPLKTIKLPEGTPIQTKYDDA